MNENDSEKIAGMLEMEGYTKAANIENTDILVINTCSIRENANNRFFGNLGSFKTIKKEKPDMILAVCGCMMQQEEIVDIIRNKYRYVDIIFGTHNLYKFPQLLNERINGKKPVYEIIKDTSVIHEEIPIKHEYNHKAYVSITFGCDNFCTYCIVPYTRGREKSRTSENILNEVKSLANKGCKEIMLLGQNVNSYGKGLNEDIDFSKLLRRLNEIDGIQRIRFMTSHPKDLSDKMIDAIEECDKVCKNIHLPLQSGSNSILKAMNRKYTKEHYLSLIDKLRDKIPDITISTDIIVGFPSETEEDFMHTLDVVEKVKYDSAFTFIYSPRNGTIAAKMPYEISESTLKDRFDRLIKLQHGIMADLSEKYVGTVQEVLTDGFSKTDKNMLCGRTRSNKLVNFLGNSREGDIVNVLINNATPFHLKGEMLK